MVNINVKINPTETHIVPHIASPIRLQEYGVGIFTGAFTKSALKKALKKKYITVDDVIASTATFIKGGECIRLSIPPEISEKRKLILSLQVLFEDDYLALIHKPAGILVSGNSFRTIANALPQHLDRSKLVDATAPQPIHRLDFATTGILLVGKTSTSIRALSKLFEDKEVQKTYYAVTIGAMNASGKINLEIDGKKAQSTYEVIACVPSKKYDKLNLVRLSPQTGRRHQLRKHLSSIGNPILGDKEYGMENLISSGNGLYLHAYSLRFVHPFTKKQIHVKDELPSRFHKIFTNLAESKTFASNV